MSHTGRVCITDRIGQRLSDVPRPGSDASRSPGRGISRQPASCAKAAGLVIGPRSRPCCARPCGASMRTHWATDEAALPASCSARTPGAGQLVLQRQLGEGIAAAPVVAEAGLVLASSAPARPGPDVPGIGRGRLDQGREQAADLR